MEAAQGEGERVNPRWLPQVDREMLVVCRAQDRIWQVVRGARDLYDPRYPVAYELSRSGLALVRAALALHAIDCAQWRLSGLTLRVASRVDGLPLSQVWERQHTAQQTEILDWLSIQTGWTREGCREQLHRFGYPDWWGEHPGRASAGVDCAAPEQAGPGSDNTKEQVSGQ